MPEGQILPHLPQLSGSSDSSTHMPLHSTSGGVQPSSNASVTTTSLAGPSDLGPSEVGPSRLGPSCPCPSCLGPSVRGPSPFGASVRGPSCFGLASLDPSLWPESPSPTHLLSLHTPPGQTMPHPPQSFGSSVVSTHVRPHWVKPVAQAPPTTSLSTPQP